MKFQSAATALSLVALASAQAVSPPIRGPKMSSERLQRDIKTQK